MWVCNVGEWVVVVVGGVFLILYVFTSLCHLHLFHFSSNRNVARVINNLSNVHLYVDEFDFRL